MIFSICRFLSKIATFFFYKRKAVHLDRLPRGAAIVAPSHNSFFDPIALQQIVDEKMYQFARTSLSSWAPVRWFLTQIACLPVIHRQGTNAASFKCALQIFQRGDKIVIYPEGKRSHDGNLQPGQIGIGMLAVTAQVPIVPVYIGGSYECWNRHQTLPSPGHTITCVFGHPIYFDDLIHNASLDKRKRYELAVDRVMQALHELKREYEEQHATTLK